MLAQAEEAQIIPIADNNGKDTLFIWCAILLSCFILYMIITLIHDIVREKRIEKYKSTGLFLQKHIDIVPMWLQFILRVGIPVLGVLFLLSKVVCITIVASGSMEPKLKTGNTAVYNRLAYTKTFPKRGDIIGFWSQEFNATYAKRVVGIAGDNVEFHNGYVYINGMRADESRYLDDNIATNSKKTFTVPDGCVFVLGDNRRRSIDSRFWSNPYISCDDIVGKYIGQVPFVLPDIFGIAADDRENRSYTAEDVRMTVELMESYSGED